MRMAFGQKPSDAQPCSWGVAMHRSKRKKPPEAVSSGGLFVLRETMLGRIDRLAGLLHLAGQLLVQGVGHGRFGP